MRYTVSELNRLPDVDRYALRLHTGKQLVKQIKTDDLKLENERLKDRIYKARCFEKSMPSASEAKLIQKESETYRKLASHYHNCPNFLTQKESNYKPRELITSLEPLSPPDPALRMKIK